MKLVGYRRSSFKAPDTGLQIEGYNLYLMYEQDNVVGYAVERVFLSDRKLAAYQPHLGDELSFVYNRYGKIDSLHVVEAS